MFKFLCEGINSPGPSSTFVSSNHVALDCVTYPLQIRQVSKANNVRTDRKSEREHKEHELGTKFMWLLLDDNSLLQIELLLDWF